MSRSLDWLATQLDITIEEPLPLEGMDKLRDTILESREVVVFGAGAGGLRAYKTLKRLGVEVLYFIDNRPQNRFLGAPVYLPESSPKVNCPIVIASAWFVTIAKQLDAEGWFSVGQSIFPLPDVLQLESLLYDDMGGWPFYEILERRLTDFQQVADLWDDEISRRRFLNLILYRLLFFRPQTLNPDRLPCTESRYSEGEKLVLNLKLPAVLSSEMKGLINYQYSHPSYSEEGFMQPRLGDVVIDGGAWQGDTAYWYAQQIGTHGRIFSFEPGEITRNKLVENIDLLDLSETITVEASALGAVEGRASWCDLPNATPCSHISSRGSTIPVTTIDSYVERNSLGPVDVIKLDVEGYDYKALHGAKKTVCKNRPDLAISIYHSPHHLVDVPLWIAAQNLGYSMRLSHNQISVTETVCLATVRGIGR